MRLSVFHTRSTFKGYVFSRTPPCPHDQEIFLGWYGFDAGLTAGTCSSRSRDYKAKTNPQMKYNRNCKTNQIQIQSVSAMGRVSVGVHCSGRAWFSLQHLPTEGPLTTSSSVARYLLTPPLESCPYNAAPQPLAFARHRGAHFHINPQPFLVIAL